MIFSIGKILNISWIEILGITQKVVTLWAKYIFLKLFNWYYILCQLIKQITWLYHYIKSSINYFIKL